jgi:hypothetical protein
MENVYLRVPGRGWLLPVQGSSQCSSAGNAHAKQVCELQVDLQLQWHISTVQ